MVLGGRERREREIMELMLNRAKLDIINGGVNRGYGAGYPMMGGYGGMGYGGYGMGGYGMTASPHVGNPYAANAWARAQPVYCGQREANGQVTYQPKRSSLAQTHTKSKAKGQAKSEAKADAKTKTKAEWKKEKAEEWRNILCQMKQLNEKAHKAVPSTNVVGNVAKDGW